MTGAPLTSIAPQNETPGTNIFQLQQMTILVFLPCVSVSLPLVLLLHSFRRRTQNLLPMSTHSTSSNRPNPRPRARLRTRCAAKTARRRAWKDGARSLHWASLFFTAYLRNACSGFLHVVLARWFSLQGVKSRSGAGPQTLP